MRCQGSQLALENINKWFGETQVLNNIQLTIQPGELICFLGPSGCGKTTLLRIIAGLEQQNSGTLLQGQRDISTLAVKERDFGIVFQSYALFPNMSLFDNVAFGLRCQGTESRLIKQRVNELLDLVELSEHAHKFPAQISGGQQQRVALARALAPAPGLLLLDEPLSALDAKVRAHLRHGIRSLQKRLGVTTIMVTHDQEEALAMADRIVVMNHGVIEQIGTPEQIYNQPASAFVAHFIGQMNFMTPTQQSQIHRLSAVQQALATQHPCLVDKTLRIAVRPEHVSLVATHESHIQAQINHIEFMGAFLRCALVIEGITEELYADVTISLAQRLQLRTGDHVGVLLQAESIHCFAA
ncbi:putative 2-aminoethylphosphonate ABC transporter ATP-binding protein [Vibrio sp. 11986-1-5]|uniref:putative 2-aminoethylphosphonate ABC transporter ATP-binding protein n=1 Tax=Vibrio sp. 11986-1-5 TaxID=2211215 RepID=UPI000D73D24E|nr:putative 2-aminoethylphosphonate ABC transporter ATP-binding protein [Vibrio sp. 11986-1-5]PXA74021.1 putative 2-aminoethylphosphonate ABC transporter ATP-binding protein [Vibrio sp. 11986-1-5]